MQDAGGRGLGYVTEIAVVTCVHRGTKSRLGRTCTVRDMTSLSF